MPQGKKKGKKGVSFGQTVASGTRSGAQNQQLNVTQNATHANSAYDRKPDYERGPYFGKSYDRDWTTGFNTKINRDKGRLFGLGGKRKSRKLKKTKKTKKGKQSRKTKKR